MEAEEYEEAGRLRAEITRLRNVISPPLLLTASRILRPEITPFR